MPSAAVRRYGSIRSSRKNSRSANAAARPARPALSAWIRPSSVPARAASADRTPPSMSSDFHVAEPSGAASMANANRSGTTLTTRGTAPGTSPSIASAQAASISARSGRDSQTAATLSRRQGLLEDEPGPRDVHPHRDARHAAGQERHAVGPRVAAQVLGTERPDRVDVVEEPQLAGRPAGRDRGHRHRAVKPPSMERQVPLTNAASGEAR